MDWKQAPASPRTNQQQESADGELRVLGYGWAIRRGRGSLPDIKQRRRHGDYCTQRCGWMGNVERAVHPMQHTVLNAWPVRAAAGATSA